MSFPATSPAESSDRCNYVNMPSSTGSSSAANANPQYMSLLPVSSASGNSF